MVRCPTPLGAIAALLSLPHCSALIETTTVAEDGVSATQIASPFGAAAGGYMQFDVEPQATAIPERCGRSTFCLPKRSVTTQYFESLTEMSDMDEADDPPPVCLAPSTGRFEVTGSGSFNLSFAHHDVYSAYLVVCKPEGSFSGEITSTFLNLVPEGGLTQHLPIQQAMLPTLYTLMSVMYAALTAAWIGEMLRLRRHVLPVHLLCLACVFVRTVLSIVRAAYFQRLSETGGSNTLAAAVLLFYSLFTVVFLLTLLLFSLGWGFIRPSLRSKEGWLVSITIGFYAGVSLLQANCRDSSQWCDGVGLIEYAVRSLIMLSTVVAINFNITHIRFCIQV
ncbi:unnamed protein product, partial [Scytosiphon promiscuus]